MGERLLEPIRRWRWKRRIKYSRRKTERARMQAAIHRQHRKRLESMYPDRETLPLGVWLREFARMCWDSIALRVYPLSWLERRAGNA